MPVQNLDETAKKILAAASKRFLHYGYGKTTMSEIAGDCNMSTGNVYRYFPSKLDIAETFVRVLRQEQMERLRRIAEAPDLSPQDKLRQLLKTKFKLSYDRFHNRPRAYELAAEILKERPHFAVEWEESEGQVIATILGEGAERGVFENRDQTRLAKIIQDAVYRFTSPAVFHEGEYEVLSGELDEVIDLMLDAFSIRNERARSDLAGERPQKVTH